MARRLILATALLLSTPFLLRAEAKVGPPDGMAPHGRPWLTSSIPYFESHDANLNADWDWREEFYDVYWDRPPAQLWTVTSPFYSEFTGGVAFTKDFEPEDGWVLLARNFGSSNNYLKYPYFILYNRHTGLLRVFVLLSLLEDHTTGSVSLSFDPALSGTAALLTHASNRAWAVDRMIEQGFTLRVDVRDLVTGRQASATQHVAYRDGVPIEEKSVRGSPPGPGGAPAPPGYGEKTSFTTRPARPPSPTTTDRRPDLTISSRSGWISPPRHTSGVGRASGGAVLPLAPPRLRASPHGRSGRRPPPRTGTTRPTTATIDPRQRIALHQFQRSASSRGCTTSGWPTRG